MAARSAASGHSSKRVQVSASGSSEHRDWIVFAFVLSRHPSQLSADDFAVSKLLVFRGSPGAGKSSFLRLFQTESLIALYSKRDQPSYDVIAEVLSEVGVFGDGGIGTWASIFSATAIFGILTMPM